MTSDEHGCEPDTSVVPNTASAATIDRISVGFCPKCGYDLRGRKVPGRCPECGRDYFSSAELATRPYPSAFAVVALFGWPLVLFAATFGIFFANPGDPYAILGWMFFCALVFLVSIINGAIVTSVLLKKFVPRRPIDDVEPGGDFHSRLGRLGVHAIVLFHLMVIIPTLIGGGCVLLVCAGGLVG